MSIPDTAAILRLLDALEQHTADELESQFLDFKPWQGPKEDLRLACEYASCFVNGSGGVVVFGVADKVRGPGSLCRNGSRVPERSSDDQ